MQADNARKTRQNRFRRKIIFFAAFRGERSVKIRIQTPRKRFSRVLGAILALKNGVLKNKVVFSGRNRAETLFFFAKSWYNY